MDAGCVIFILFVLLVVFAWSRRRGIVKHYPGTRDLCWGVHKNFPCLEIYPSDATDAHSIFAEQANIVQANPITTGNPSSEVDSSQPTTVAYGFYPTVAGPEIQMPYYDSLPEPNISPPNYSTVTVSDVREY